MRAEVSPGRSRVALDVRPDSQEARTLARFSLDGESGPPGWFTDLEWLAGDYRTETWTGCGEATVTDHGDCRVRAGEDLAMIALALPDDGEDDLAPLAETAYRRLLECLDDLPAGVMVRLWNYLPAINRGEGDDERYRRFCLGRGRALSAAGLTDEALCAGTAIGTRGGHLRIYCLAAAGPGTQIENPRQVSAYQYPRQYGPCSPSFARATALPRTDGTTALLISGTASVVGHATVHPGDLDAQLDETVDNLESLLDTAARRLGRQALAEFDERSLLRVYLRRPEAADRVLTRLRQAWPGVHIAVLQGDICRRDLEVEIEAWHVG